MSDYEDFLDATMVYDGDIVQLLDEGVFKEPEVTKLSRTVFHIRVRLQDGRKKIWSMNKTTRRRLAKAWGDDSSNWVGKNVKISITQQNVQGKMRDVLWGEPSNEKYARPASITQSKMDAQNNTQQIVAEILNQKPELNAEQVQEMIEEELLNSGGMFSEQVATVLVARILGVDLGKR